MGKQKVVFLLGNGFSQGFDFPSIQDLWTRSLEPSHDYYKNSLGEAKKVYPLKYFISKNICDIELLLTVWKCYWDAHEAQLDSNAQESGRGYFEDYVENICAWLHRFTLKSGEMVKFEEFKTWLIEVGSKYQVSFLTTNYDLLLEKAISDSKPGYHFLSSEKDNSIPIRKLHGSISWFSSSHAHLRSDNNFTSKTFFKNENKNLYVYDFTSDCLSFPTIAGIHMQWGSQLRSDNVVAIPTLIPPVVGKEYNELFKSVISSAESDFEDCKYFVILGYSFPASDPIIQDLISSFVKKYLPEQDKCVLFINSNPTDCAKAKEIFGSRINIVAEKWTMAHLKDIKYCRAL